MEPVAFQHFAAHKTRDAATSSIERLSTAFDRRQGSGLDGTGNGWSRLHYGGEFGLVRASARQTVVPLVFIQTKDGNTGGPNPGVFGGGATDRDAVFSVWHPELVALRASLALPRHPAQIVVSKRGRLDFDALLFNVAHLRVFLLTGDECVARHESALGDRPWIRVIPLNGDDLDLAFERLRFEEGIQRISAIGGRSTATQLVDGGLAQDIYLTTTSLEGGEPATSWYCGASAPQLTAITSKQWHESGSQVVFEHCLITSHREFSLGSRQPGVSGPP